MTHGYNICLVVITSTTQHPPTLQWLFHLPLGNNICHHIILKKYGYNIYHNIGNNISQ